MVYKPDNFNPDNYIPDNFFPDEVGPPPSFTGAGFVGGTAIDANGVMGTDFLADGVPVPAGSIAINGFAHSPAGLRYVCPWPASGIVFHLGGIARRADGAMCVAVGGVANAYAAAWALTFRGEVLVSIGPPEVPRAGYGLRQDGILCISEAA